MDSKSIPLSHNNLKELEHDKGVLGANSYTNGHIKGPWNHINNGNNYPASASYASVDNVYTKLSGFSWPPRLYVCSFCKREFRSAQALGGHMNVHRRDRARLRQSPPASTSSPPDQLVINVCPPMTTVADTNNLNRTPNPNPSPNPNLIYSSSWMIRKPHIKTTNYITHSSALPSPQQASPFFTSSSSTVPVSGIANWSAIRPTPFTTSTFIKTSNLIDVYNKENRTIPEVKINNAREKGELLRLGFGTYALRKEDVDLELRLGNSS